MKTSNLKPSKSFLFYSSKAFFKVIHIIIGTFANIFKKHRCHQTL
jgi:hypothetical protein